MLAVAPWIKHVADLATGAHPRSTRSPLSVVGNKMSICAFTAREIVAGVLLRALIGLSCSEVGLIRRFLFCAIAFALSVIDAAAESGIASVYSTESGGKTASGQRLNPGALTAAHRSLPFGTKVLVSNRKNGRSVLVTINDRGPFIRGRVIDVTPAAARALGFSGLTSVSLQIQ